MILLLQIIGAVLLAVMAGLIAVFLLECETEEPSDAQMSEGWRRDQRRGQR